MANSTSSVKGLTKAYEDIERIVTKDGQKVTEIIDAKTQKRIIQQVNEEYLASYRHTEAKRAVMLQRLVLYNNQRKTPDSIGDPLLFTIFNTVMSSLYDDRLMAVWEARVEEKGEDIEENLNALSEYDYDLMQKDQADYEWIWDAGFFGRGLLLQMDFDRTPGKMCPVPEVIDPTTWIRDTRATSVNGDYRGKGAMRFGGFESGATYWELKNSPAYFNVENLRKDREIRSTLYMARMARDRAQGRDMFPGNEDSLGKHRNYEFNLLNWFTTIKGQKYLITLGNVRTELVRLIKLDYDGRWPITDRALYPMAHDWDGVSIPDLVEDKQRMRAVLLNLGLSSAKADAMPRYLYDKQRIKNKSELNYRQHKYIGVDGQTKDAIVPVPSKQVDNTVNLIMNILSTSAERATSATDIRQGAESEQKRTLGEQQMATQAGNLRFSLTAKIFGWSEKAFWRQWYFQYKKHFKNEIDKKLLRIQGPMGPLWKPIQKEDITSEIDPEVRIESRVISDQKRSIQLQTFQNFAGMVLQDPTVNRRFVQKKLARLNNMKKVEVDLIFPPTVDEMQAEDENAKLNKGVMAPVDVRDDHLVHLSIHQKATQNAQSIAHILMHKKLMLVKRNNPQLFPQQSTPSLQLPGSQQVNPGANANPNGTAAPTAPANNGPM